MNDQHNESRRRILIIDDSNLSRMMLMKKIRKISDSFAIEEAGTGRAGIQKIKELQVRNETYKIVFLDHLMPEMDGLETLKIIREICPDLPVVMITANVQTKVKDDAMKFGCNEFINKTTEGEHLAGILKGIG